MAVWYDIKLNPPPQSTKVLVACTNAKGIENINIGYFTDGDHFHGMGSSAKVTHWMKLPKTPKEIIEFRKNGE